MPYRLVLLSFILATACSSPELPPGDRDGQVNALEDGGFVAWDAGNRQWVDADTFWKNFAARGRGRNWPSGREFPPYSAVNEHDSFLYNSENGPCLMYFFHARWRRANDVWRWGDEFNEYGGCARVFE